MLCSDNNTGRNLRRCKREEVTRTGRGCTDAFRARGFTLLELMIVLSVMMVLLAIAIPAYNRHIIQTREAVLKSNVIMLDKLIQQYTLDKRQAPQSLEDLKTGNYLHDLPKDPMTGAADWDTEQEDPQSAADPNQPGITRVHSHSSGTSLEGEPYSSW